MNTGEKEKIKQWIVLCALLATGLIILFSLQEFLTSFLGAIIFFVLFKPFMERLTDKRGWKPASAAWLILFISFLIFMVPVVILGYMLYHEVKLFSDSPSLLLDYVAKLDLFTRKNFGFDLLSGDTVNKVKKELLTWVSGALNGTLNLIGVTGIMYFILYYMLIYSRQLTAGVRFYSPFTKRENVKLFIEELKLQTHSNALAVPILAIIQGAAAALGYWIFGLDQPGFWGIISGFFSIIPVVGTAIIWIPATLVIYSLGNNWQALGLLLYGGLIISNIDNVMRFMLQKKFADVHPMITVFGVIIGLKLFGLPGLIFGPLLISYFVILIKVYRNEYWHEEDADNQSP